MTALADLKTRIAFEIDRTDMTDAIASAITSAVRAYRPSRFAFNESSGTLVTAAGTSEYSTATADPNTLPSDILEIDTARITITSSNRYVLEPVSYKSLEELDTSNSYTSRPIWFAWHAETLRLYPTPDTAYTIDLRYLADVGEETWCTRAEALIRCRAKKELYVHVLRDPQMAAAMQQIEQQELVALKREARLRASSGRVTPHD